jgi:hypothetical protein
MDINPEKITKLAANLVSKGKKTAHIEFEAIKFPPTPKLKNIKVSVKPFTGKLNKKNVGF